MLRIENLLEPRLRDLRGVTFCSSSSSSSGSAFTALALGGPRLRARARRCQFRPFKRQEELEATGSKLTNGLWDLLAIGIGGLHLADGLVDLGPHVLERLGGTAGHIDLVPADSLVVVTLQLGNDVEEKLALFRGFQSRVRIWDRRQCAARQLTLASSVQAPALPGVSWSDMMRDAGTWSES